MELWRVYRFILFIKKHPDTEYVKLQSDYDKKKHKLSGSELWDMAAANDYVEATTSGVRLTYKGRKLTEMWGYGFLVAAIKEYGGPIVLLAGIASIINLIVIIARSRTGH